MNNHFFNVEIGRDTKAGNLQVQHSFVVGVPENKHQADVYNFYCERYKGFNIRVLWVESIFCDVNRDTEKTNVAVKPKVFVRKGVLEHYKYDSSFPDEIRQKWNDLKGKKKVFDKEFSSLNDLLKKHISSIYGTICNDVDITKEFKVENSTVYYTIDISGSIVIKEIEEKLQK